MCESEAGSDRVGTFSVTAHPGAIPGALAQRGWTLVLLPPWSPSPRVTAISLPHTPVPPGPGPVGASSLNSVSPVLRGISAFLRPCFPWTHVHSLGLPAPAGHDLHTNTAELKIPNSLVQRQRLEEGQQPLMKARPLIRTLISQRSHPPHLP